MSQSGIDWASVPRFIHLPLFHFLDTAFFTKLKFVATLCQVNLSEPFFPHFSLHVSVSHFSNSHNIKPSHYCCCCSAAQSCPTLCDPMDCSTPASLSLTISRSLLKLVSIELVMPSSHLVFCRPLLLPNSIFSSLRVFSNESVFCIRWTKYWSISFSISPSYVYSGLISFRIDWFDLLAVQGTLKSPPTP